jgi:ferredoxin-NADP reductase
MAGPEQALVLSVTDVRAEARDVMMLELRAPNGGPLPRFEPGAHLEIALPNGLVRHYSLVNDWRETDRYVVAVGRAPDSRGGASCVHQLVRCGAQLRVSPPRNNFALDPTASSFLFIAGGIGITPIMAMIRWCEKNERPWRLIYAARSRQRAAFYEDLCAYGGERVRFHFDDERGQLLDAEAAIAGLAPGEKIYCCGPGPLMTAVSEATRHLPPGSVRFEWFTAAADPISNDADDAFRVRLARTGIELPIPAGKSILEVLEENGISHPFSCREGLCGTCQTAVCEGEPDHRDYVLSDEERLANGSMMICVSRSRSPLLVLDL